MCFYLIQSNPFLFFAASPLPTLQVHKLIDYGLSNVAEMAALMPLLANINQSLKYSRGTSSNSTTEARAQ